MILEKLNTAVVALATNENHTSLSQEPLQVIAVQELPGKSNPELTFEPEKGLVVIGTADEHVSPGGGGGGVAMQMVPVVVVGEAAHVYTRTK